MSTERLRALLGDRPVHVLLGGFSNEREVSLQSGEAVAAALEERGHRVARLDVSRDFEQVGRDLLAGTGLAFIILHGEFGEDGQIQRLLEGWSVPYTGSDSASSRSAMDKVLTKRCFEQRGIETPRWEIVEPPVDGAALVEKYGLPLVVKPSESGSSIGVTIAREEGAVAPAVEEAAKCRGVVMVEEFVGRREVTVGILGEEALPIVELVPQREFYDYEAKYSDDAGTEYLCPAPLDAEVTAALQAEGLAAHRALACRDFSRVDLRLGEDGSGSVMEVNTIPGFTSHSLLPKAAAEGGTCFADLVEKIAVLALERAARDGTDRGGT